MKHATFGCLLAAVLPAAVWSAEPAAPMADLILSKGEIRTPSGWAQSMAVAKGVILAVGDDQAIAAYRGAYTTAIVVAYLEEAG